MLEIVLSSATVKILKKEDCAPIASGRCLKNESFAYQLFLTADGDFCGQVSLESDVNGKIYLVKKLQGNDHVGTRTDEFYLKSEDGAYPDLLQEVKTLTLNKGENATLYVEIPADDKSVGEHKIVARIGDYEAILPLTMLPATLDETDAIVTHWFHLDGICHYYGVEPFSAAFYARFEQFLKAYVKMGNTMLLIPLFTPPLDTEVGKERLTTQLVGVEKVGEKYLFDFAELKKYLALVQSYGIKYFEFSHLFTQWGGTSCPKIEVVENGKLTKPFGWDCPSTDEKYLAFLRQFFAAFIPLLKELKIKEKSYLHLTDEPSGEHIEKYGQLSAFVKEHADGVKTIDALSHYEFAERDFVDLPAVSMQSDDLPLFANRDRLIYYCVWVDKNHITNRYFHMPALRTVILGFQLYLEGGQGFLHWGYNFYNTQYSKAPVDPYVDATAGGGFVAGDSYLVYPGQADVEYSLRYFSMLQAFEDYRLAKTAERKIGRAGVVKLLNELGVVGVHDYPHAVEDYRKIREKLYEIVVG